MLKLTISTHILTYRVKTAPLGLTWGVKIIHGVQHVMLNRHRYVDMVLCDDNIV